MAAPDHSEMARCSHPVREIGQCTACGHCLHEVILNGACYICGATELDGLAVSPKKPDELIPPTRLLRKKDT